MIGRVVEHAFRAAVYDDRIEYGASFTNRELHLHPAFQPAAQRSRRVVGIDAHEWNDVAVGTRRHRHARHCASCVDDAGARLVDLLTRTIDECRERFATEPPEVTEAQWQEVHALTVR